MNSNYINSGTKYVGGERTAYTKYTEYQSIILDINIHRKYYKIQ